MKKTNPFFGVTKRKWLQALFLLTLVFAFTRCGRDGTGRWGFYMMRQQPGTFSAVYNNTLKRACVECHVAGGSAETDSGVKLDFSDQASAFKSLKRETVNGRVARTKCKDVEIVSDGNISKSYLVAVLIEEYNKTDVGKPGCIPYNVHLQDQNLDDSEKESIKTWIKNGAKNDKP